MCSSDLRQIEEAGVDAEHLNTVREIAMKTTREAMRRLSVQCAKESRIMRLLQGQKRTPFCEAKRGNKVGPMNERYANTW